MLNYFSIISIQWYHTDEFKEKATIYCVRIGHSLWSAISCRECFFVLKLQYFLSFKYILSITRAKQIINLLLLSNFYRVQKKKKGTNYGIRLGHSLWSANQLPAQSVNATCLLVESERYQFEIQHYISVLNILHLHYYNVLYNIIYLFCICIFRQPRITSNLSTVPLRAAFFNEILSLLSARRLRENSPNN